MDLGGTLQNCTLVFNNHSPLYGPFLLPGGWAGWSGLLFVLLSISPFLNMKFTDFLLLPSLGESYLI